MLEPWSRVHIDHKLLSGGLLILVNTFSGWPEVVHVSDKFYCETHAVIFSRNGIPQTLVSDNVWWRNQIMAMTDRMQVLRDTTISPSIIWYSGKSGTNHKKKIKNFSTLTASHLPHWTNREPISTGGKTNQSSLNSVIFCRQKDVVWKEFGVEFRKGKFFNKAIIQPR